MALQDARAEEAAAFRFSQPEDVAENPENETQIVMVPTGRGVLFDAQTDTNECKFGARSGAEASVWQLNPATSQALQILEMGCTAVPAGQGDPTPSDTSAWESSGVLGIAFFFCTDVGETTLILDL